MTEIDTLSRSKKLANYSVVFGIALYLSKFLRDHFTHYQSVLFALGFLPNFGLAFTIPFIYLGNRVRQKKPVKHFELACVVSLLLMVLNEVRDIYQTGRVFDWLDVFASFVGVVTANLVFHVTIKKDPTALPW